MATFDPKKAREEGNQGIPPADYLLAIKTFERKESKKGKDYLLCKIGVIHGAAKGKTFRDIISLDVDNSGTAFRLSLLMEGVGHEEAIDLRSDEDLRKALINRPFKAKVNRKVENGYTNNGIERYLVGQAVTDGEREIMNDWVIDASATDDYDNPGGGDVPPPGDDDIPF
jgi:hypothetical protein